MKRKVLILLGILAIGIGVGLLFIKPNVTEQEKENLFEKAFGRRTGMALPEETVKIYELERTNALIEIKKMGLQDEYDKWSIKRSMMPNPS